MSTTTTKRPADRVKEKEETKILVALAERFAGNTRGNTYLRVLRSRGWKQLMLMHRAELERGIPPLEADTPPDRLTFEQIKTLVWMIKHGEIPPETLDKALSSVLRSIEYLEHADLLATFDVGHAIGFLQGLKKQARSVRAKKGRHVPAAD